MTSSTDETIVVNVRPHAILRTLVNADAQNQVALTLPRHTTVAGALRSLALPEMEMVFSLNDQIVNADAELNDGDQLSLIPAISGGATCTLAHIRSAGQCPPSYDQRWE